MCNCEVFNEVINKKKNKKGILCKCKNSKNRNYLHDYAEIIKKY